MVDAKEMRNDLKRYLATKGIMNTEQPFMCLNPEHDDHTPSMHFYTNNDGEQRVKCFACGANYGVIDLIALDEGLATVTGRDGAPHPADNGEAIRTAARVLGYTDTDENTSKGVKKMMEKKTAVITETEKAEPEETMVAENLDWKAWVEALEKDGFAYPKSRGLSEAVCRAYGLGLMRKGYNSYLVFPTSETSYNARNTNPNCEKTARYRKTKSANTHFFPEENLKKDKLFVVEGEMDALALIDAGYPAIALGGAGNALKFVDAVNAMEKAPTIVVLPDPDDKGIECRDNILKGIKDSISADLSDTYKDASEYWQKDPEGFKARMAEINKMKMPRDRWAGLEKLTREDFYSTGKNGEQVHKADSTDKMRKMKQAVLSQLRYVSDTVCVPVTQRNRPTLYKPFDTSSCSLTMDKFSEYCDVPTMDKSSEVRDIKTKVDGLFLEIPKPDEPQSPALCLFRNGVADITKREGASEVDTETFTSFVPHDWNPDAEADEVVDKFINDITLGNEEQMTLIWEMIGACLYGKLEFRTMFLLTGQAACGKSTLQRFIIYLLGIDNVSTLKLEDLDERFNRVDLFGKLAIVGDDIDTKYVKNVSFAKSIIAGEMVRGEYKGKDGFSFRNMALPIFSCNGKPTFSDDGNAMSSRVCVVECKADFSKNPDPLMSEKLCTEHAAQYAIQKGAKAYTLAHQNGKFSFGSETEKAKKDYEKELSPLRAFLVDEWFELSTDEPDQARVSTLVNGRQCDREVFMEYNLWLNRVGLIQRSERAFRKELKDVIGACNFKSRCRNNPVAGQEWKLNKELITESQEGYYIRPENKTALGEFIDKYSNSESSEELMQNHMDGPYQKHEVNISYSSEEIAF